MLKDISTTLECAVRCARTIGYIRKLGCLNSIDRDFHDQVVLDYYAALDGVWVAQQACDWLRLARILRYPFCQLAAPACGPALGSI